MACVSLQSCRSLIIDLAVYCIVTLINVCLSQISQTQEFVRLLELLSRLFESLFNSQLNFSFTRDHDQRLGFIFVYLRKKKQRSILLALKTVSFKAIRTNNYLSSPVKWACNKLTAPISVWPKVRERRRALPWGIYSVCQDQQTCERW